MRPGLIVSAVGHVGAVLLTLIAWPQQALPRAEAGTVVSVEIVNIGEISNVRALTNAPEDAVETPSPADAVQQQQTPPEAAPAPTPRPPQQRQRAELDLNSLGSLLADKN